MPVHSPGVSATWPLAQEVDATTEWLHSPLTTFLDPLTGSEVIITFFIAWHRGPRKGIRGRLFG